MVAIKKQLKKNITCLHALCVVSPKSQESSLTGNSNANLLFLDKLSAVASYPGARCMLHAKDQQAQAGSCDMFFGREATVDILAKNMVFVSPF